MSAADCGRSGPDSLTAAVPETRVPDMSITYTSPALDDAPGAPATRSGSPSPLMSADATDSPKWWLTPASPCGTGISCVRLGSASDFMNRTCSTPEFLKPGASSPPAPTTMSGIWSPSMSPTPATPEPNQSPARRDGPLAVPALTSWADFTVPFLFMSSTCSAPLLLLPPLSSHLLPTARSGTPSPSRSPTNETASPKLSCALMDTPEPSRMVDADFTVLSWFIRSTCTAPVPLPV